MRFYILAVLENPLYTQLLAFYRRNHSKSILGKIWDEKRLCYSEDCIHGDIIDTIHSLLIEEKLDLHRSGGLYIGLSDEKEARSAFVIASLLISYSYMCIKKEREK